MKRLSRRLKGILMTCGMTVYFLGGCAAAEEFRSVAGDSLHSGVTSIATGIIDGIFAVFEPDSTS